MLQLSGYINLLQQELNPYYDKAFKPDKNLMSFSHCQYLVKGQQLEVVDMTPLNVACWQQKEHVTLTKNQ